MSYVGDIKACEESGEHEVYHKGECELCRIKKDVGSQCPIDSGFSVCLKRIVRNVVGRDAERRCREVWDVGFGRKHKGLVGIQTKERRYGIQGR